MATTPCAGCVTDSISFGPASVSVSFWVTSIAVAPASSETVATSSTAAGGSSTALIVRSTVAGPAESAVPSFAL